ncbi:hydrogen peroxide-inducible genes activator [Chondromyces apiculatus]|uniref:Hydrogen peroxide-inducible activator n=1 Tax=Chondromyces apiculatus DSM 436 TaxID=1192034 RepID=A0A017T9I8_9BACT|nr:hydrogen peroxide-inducible genes activator [Chondromyces apiculatus]EYF05480.1 Hydrogen peroxide-inducible activator [Chondromyces apiculatus DSM 436]
MALDLSSLTLTQLRYLVAVDRHRSFRVAAEHSSVSQPALSMQIQKLEGILGGAIFDRSRHPTVTTELGARIVAQARVILHECDRLGQLAEAGDDPSGTYRLGIIPTLAPTLVPLFLPRFLAAYPRVSLVVEELPTSALIQSLLDDSLDGGLAATPLDVPQIHERPLFLEPFYVYLSPNHPLRAQAALRQEDLADERIWLLAEGHCFRAQVLQLCDLGRRSAREVPTSRFESGSLETLVRLVDAGEGITLLPELVVQSLPEDARLARVRPFRMPIPSRKVSFVFGRNQLRGSVADAIVRTILSSLPETTLGASDAAEGWAVIPPR